MRHNNQQYAMTKALHHLRGQTVYLSQLLSAFRHYGGDARKFDYYLDKFLENRKDLTLIYHRTKGWYTEVFIKISA